MPYEWVEPDLFLEYQGVAVYHCYDDNDIVSSYWYTTASSDDNRDWPQPETAQFDARELPDLGLDANDPANHAAIIRGAIEAGLISGEPAVEADPLIVKIEVLGGVATVVEKPPGVEVEITDHDRR